MTQRYVNIGLVLYVIFGVAFIAALTILGYGI